MSSEDSNEERLARQDFPPLQRLDFRNSIAVIVIVLVILIVVYQLKY